MITDEKNQEEFASIEIIAKDRNGLVHEITGIISELNIAILHHEARVYKNKNKGMVSDFKVDVKADNHNQIEILIRRLNKIKSVISVH